MKSILYKFVVITGLAFGLISFNASAGLMTSGSWSDPQGSSSSINIESYNTEDDLIYWGKGKDPSAWLFKGVYKDLGADDIVGGDWFKIGKLYHWNSPIYDWDFTGANLNLSLSLGGDMLSPLSFFFGHNETLNRPCGSAGCDDFVTIPSLASTDTITIGGMVYEMTITGFSKRSNMYYSEFQTPEYEHNKAYLYASLAKVPEPSIIALFGIGLLGLGFASRRKANG